MKRKKLSGYTMVLFSAVLWGFIPVFTRSLYARGLDSFQISSFRGYISAVVVLMGLIICRDFRNFRLRDIPFYMLYGACAVCGTYILYVMSIGMNSTAVASILLYTGPAFVNILNRIFYKIPLTRRKCVSLAVVFLGCCLVVKMYDLNFFHANLKGILIGLGSGLCYSMTTVLGEKAEEKYSGRVNAWLMMLFGGIAFLFIEPPGNLPALTPDTAWICVGFAVVCSFIPYTLYILSLDTGIDGGVASIVATVEPIAAIILCYVFYRETIGAVQFAGIILVLIGLENLVMKGEQPHDKPAAKVY